MKQALLSARRPIAVAIIVCLVSSSGCAGWQMVSREEMVREVRDYGPTKVRVFLPDSTLEIRDPFVRADTLAGTAKNQGRVWPSSFSLAQIDSAAIRRTPRKVVRYLAIPVFALMVVAAIEMFESEPIPPPDR